MTHPLDWATVRLNGAQLVREIAEQIGYGRVIQIAQQARYEKVKGAGASEDSALREAGFVCVWCDIDHRTGKKFKSAKRRKKAK